MKRRATQSCSRPRPAAGRVLPASSMGCPAFPRFVRVVISNPRAAAGGLQRHVQPPPGLSILRLPRLYQRCSLNAFASWTRKGATMGKRTRRRSGPGRSEREGISVQQLADMFPDEDAAERCFMSTRWEHGRYCPRCGGLDNYRTKSGRPMPYRCRDWESYFSVRTGSPSRSAATSRCAPGR